MSVTISSINKFQKALAYCDEYFAVYNAMATKPNETNAGYQNTMVDALVSGGYWARMDLFYVFATEVNTGGEALINWYNPGTFDADNPTATVWTQYQGYIGDGTEDYISTNWNARSNSINSTLDDVAIGCYVRTNTQSNTNLFAAYDYTTYLGLTQRDNSNGTYYYLNGPYGDVSNTLNGNGLWIITRTASNETATYRNGNSFATDIDTSVSIPNSEMLILRRRTDLAAGRADEVSVFFVMDGISSGEATAINTIIEAYMDAIGTGVQ